MIRHVLTTAVVLMVTVASAGAESSLTVVGTELVLHADNGTVYRGNDLDGATLHLVVDGRSVDVMISSVEKDEGPRGGAVFLYRFVTKNESGDEVPLCTADVAGKTLGFPVSDGRGGFELACTSSAIAKCVRWGYRPWEETPKGPPLRALHAACVRMVRADYGGNDTSTTREGTLVYVCDRFGVVPCAKKPPLAFEAAWGVDGATCVARPRIPEAVSLDDLRERFPRLVGHLGEKQCRPQTAFQDPHALLINRSVRR